MAETTDLTTLLAKLQTSVASAISPLPSEEALQPKSDGISLLDTKTELFLSYLQNLAFLIILKLQRYSSDSGIDEKERQKLDDAVIKQLAELRLYLEKGVRPLESRLQYEIDKVVRAADGVKSDTTRNDASKVKTRTKKSKHRRTSDASASSASEDSASDASASEFGSDDGEQDDLAFRPNLAGIKGVQGADARGRPQSEKKTGIYRPPRVDPTSLPTTDTLNDTVRSERKARPVRSAAVDDYISNELAANPVAQPSIGSTITAGGRRTVSDKERRKEDERKRYEESNLIRLPAEGKKERQKRKRLERGGGGFGANEFGLGALADVGDRVGRATERAGKRRKY